MKRKKTLKRAKEIIEELYDNYYFREAETMLLKECLDIIKEHIEKKARNE